MSGPELSFPVAQGGPVAASLIAALPLLAVAIAYTVRARTLAQRGPPIAPWRPAIFTVCLAIFAAAILSPLDRLSSELVMAQMDQHLLIMDIGALSLVLGLTGPMMAPVLGVKLLRPLHALMQPLVSLPLWIAGLAFWHIPSIYQTATFDSATLHALEHGTFFATGALMWMSLLGPLPRPTWFNKGAALIYAAGVRLSGAALGNVFMCGRARSYVRATQAASSCTGSSHSLTRGPRA